MLRKPVRLLNLDHFGSACKDIGNNKKSFHRLLRIWVREPSNEQYELLKQAAAGNAYFTEELGIRKERIDIFNEVGAAC